MVLLSIGSVFLVLFSDSQLGTKLSDLAKRSMYMSVDVA